MRAASTQGCGLDTQSERSQTGIIRRHIARLVVGILALGFSVAESHNRPTGLMTDMVTDAGMLCRNGRRIAETMSDIAEQDFAGCQFAAVRSSRPTFGWIVPDCGRGTHQLSYRIIVSDNAADARAGRGNVWDSGTIRSRQSVAVPYGGEDLRPDKLYFWRVAVATDTGGDSGWSEIEPFRTAERLAGYAPSYRPQTTETDKPSDMRKPDPTTALFDFGRASFGWLEVTLQSPEGGDTVYVAIGEALKNGRIDSRPPGTVRYYRYPLVLEKGRRTYSVVPAHDQRNTGPQAVRIPDYMNEVAPFRYCQIEHYADGIAIGDVTRRTAIYPFDDDAAHFSSSDSTLNAVWELCKYTVKATSAFGIYIDGDRERIPYEADALINQLSHYAVDREYAMARRSSEYLLQHPTWPTEWILQALLIAWNDYLHTGDDRSIAANYELLKSRTLLSLRQDNGLISTTADKTVATPEFRRSINFAGTIRDIVDWPHGSEEDGFVFTDYNCAVNAFHFKALQ
ncbi:MAG: family 78 glycoside hydrolase catalytic domain, partial [Alistipes sp.]|nr:family 78 glycoside hydrolase catalytic domain [Alistipes sp.]